MSERLSPGGRAWQSSPLRLTRESFALPRGGEPDLEIFAVGDIHGRADLFDALLEAAAAEPRRLPRRALVLTGDLVDRGPENLRTLALAGDAARRVGADVFHALMGNHEAMMRFCLDPEVALAVGLEILPSWKRNGGSAVLAELWPGRFARGDEGEALRRSRAEMPAELLAWLRGLEGSWRSGALLFVHAGVHPAMALEAFLAQPWDMPLSQFHSGRHWSWVREPFLAHVPGPGGFSGHFVVHGHTPQDAGHTRGHAEQIARHRLNIDGGSGFTGEAKMAILRGTSAEVLTVSGPTNADLRGA